jgi:hypothetical protein
MAVETKLDCGFHKVGGITPVPVPDDDPDHAVSVNNRNHE